MSGYSFTFRSDDPDASALDVDHGAVGLKAEQLMSHEAYFNPNHRLHHRAVSDVTAAFAAMYGEKPVGGFKGAAQTINTATGEVMSADQLQQLYGSPTVFNPGAIVDEHNKAD